MDLIESIESRRSDARYWATFAVLGCVFAVDYFDFFIVGFLVADFAPKWHLTYAITAVILLAAGVGSIIGSLLGGILSDRFGRKPLLLTGNIICGLSSGCLALVPDGAWLLVVVLRLVTGVAVGLIATSAVALIVECTPQRKRTLMSGLNTTAASLGVVIASSLAGALLADLGWRGVASLGAMPLLLLPFIYFLVPESVHWQVASGRTELAYANAERILSRPTRNLGVPPAHVRSPKQGLRALYSDPRRFWLVLLIAVGVNTGIYGSYLWAPSILGAVAKISPAEAARIFALASILGVFGKIIFSILPALIGRWPTGILCVAMGTLSLAAAAFSGNAFLWGYPFILFCFMGVALFMDGGYSNFAPYSAEVFPVQLASRGVGLSQAGSGVAKILGPISLALIAGSSNVMKPQVTAGAVTPAFLFLAACAFTAFLAMAVVRIETRGIRLSLGESATRTGGSENPESSLRKHGA